MREQTAELLSGIVKLSPPVTVLTGAATGIEWQKVVWILTAAYTCLLIVQLLWRGYARLRTPDKRRWTD